MNRSLLREFRSTTSQLQLFRTLRGHRVLPVAKVEETSAVETDQAPNEAVESKYDFVVKARSEKYRPSHDPSKRTFADWDRPAPEGQVWLHHRKPWKRRFIDIKLLRHDPPYYTDQSLGAAEISKGLFRPHPKLTVKHRFYDEEKKVRRQLPLPISLTGLGVNDGQDPKFWRHRFRKAMKKIESTRETESDRFIESITPSAKLLLETCPSMLDTELACLTEKYNEAKRTAEDESRRSSLTRAVKQVNLPFDINTKLRDKLLAEVFREDEIVVQKEQSSDLTDTDYDNFSKHRDVVHYFAQNMTTKNGKASEIEPELEAWVDTMWRRNYGSPDPKVEPSQVPCGGCGAHLHCTDASIPGYIPSEKFRTSTDNQLKHQQCQRCEFLHHYNVAIDVNVQATDYPKLMSRIKEQPRALVILMVDVLDFPCSIWPNIVNVIGPNRKLYVVGNKVDLLPKDSKGYLGRVEESLKKTLHVAGIAPQAGVNMRHFSLISAKTGYGIEPLITQLCNDWNGRDDIYLIGCTNVGKSTLFNALLQSDLCAVRENDLIHRATTSVWPGTTLNLLKFPMKRMDGWQLKMRMDRLLWEEKVQTAENRMRRAQYRITQNSQYATLSNRIGMTFRQNIPFTVESGHPMANKGSKQKPLDASDKRFKNAKFFHDTPGAVYKDQILTLLTTEELLKTVPREMIMPRSFSLQPLQSLFVGGIGRIDVLSSRQNVLLTVFASQYMPIHVVYTEEAQRFYELYLGSEMLGVPLGGPERLAKWPQLYPIQVDLLGLDKRQSCADIVLSSAGWVSVTMGREEECILKAFTPEARGLFVRKPSLLPFACEMRGRKVKNSPMFESPTKAIDASGDDGYSQRQVPLLREN
ncbi:Nitric oxide-associated protein 1 [Halotydeus destructor]|nr:Nitric oxide-associated protein 1 [Halotydeus destructor]